jgi:hypothetical protein
MTVGQLVPPVNSPLRTVSSFERGGSGLPHADRRPQFESVRTRRGHRPAVFTNVSGPYCVRRGMVLKYGWRGA